MDKHEFDRAIGETPPSTVDVDAVLARERRAALVRRAVNPWVATAAGVVAVAVGAVVLLAPNTGPVGGAVIPAQPLTTTESTSAPPSSAPLTKENRPPASFVPPPCVSPPSMPETPGVAARRLTGVLPDLVGAQLPAKAKMYANPGASPHGPMVAYQVPGDRNCPNDPGYLLAMANVTNGEEKGNIIAVIQWPTSYSTPGCGNPTATPTQADCRIEHGAGGEVMSIGTENLEGGTTQYRIDAVKPDGTGIALWTENIAGTAKSGGAPQAAAPPLTHEQLKAIVLDPALTLYPAG